MHIDSEKGFTLRNIQWFDGGTQSWSWSIDQTTLDVAIRNRNGQ